MEQLERIKLSKEESEEFRKKVRREFNKKIYSYILAALGLMASLAWNDAIKSLIENFFPNRSDTVLGHFIYAVIVTLIAVIESLYLSHIFKQEESERVRENEGISMN